MLTWWSCVVQVFDLLMGDSGGELVSKLHRNTKHFREKMANAGFSVKVYNFIIVG